MPIKIGDRDMNLLGAMTHAHLINRDLTAAYYLDAADKPRSANTHLAAAHDQFRKLAAVMGYRIDPIAAETEKAAA